MVGFCTPRENDALSRLPTLDCVVNNLRRILLDCLPLKLYRSRPIVEQTQKANIRLYIIKKAEPNQPGLEIVSIFF